MVDARGLVDVLGQPLWDTVRLVPNTVVTAFAVPQGEGETLFGLGRKRAGETNLVHAGQLAAGYSFDIQALYAEPLSECDERDLHGLGAALFIGSACYVQAPWLLLRERAMGVPSGFRIEPPLRITATNNFALRLDVPATAPSAVLLVALLGRLLRPMQ